jgi:hypothetical protein
VYQPSARVEVGGDVYDFLARRRPARRRAPDVTGHGVEATADMAMAKFVFRSLAREHPEPADFLAAANEVICSEIAGGKFISMGYVVIGSARGTVAGHPRRGSSCPTGRRALRRTGSCSASTGARVHESMRSFRRASSSSTPTASSRRGETGSCTVTSGSTLL